MFVKNGIFHQREEYKPGIWEKFKQKCLSKIPCVANLESSPEAGVKVTTMYIVSTLFIPILLVGTDMVTDVEVMWSMVTPFFFHDACLEARYKETNMHAFVRALCVLGSLTIFVVELVTMFKKPGPIPYLMRSVRTTASMGSRELERNNLRVPLGKFSTFLTLHPLLSPLLPHLDHLTRFDKMIEESNGESMVQVGIQGIFYLFIIRDSVYLYGPGAETAVTFADIRFSILISLLSLANGKFKVLSLLTPLSNFQQNKGKGSV